MNRYRIFALFCILAGALFSPVLLWSQTAQKDDKAGAVSLPASSSVSSAAPASPAPTAVVSFDHLLLRENESAIVDVWLANSSDRDDAIVLNIAGTDQIGWHDGALTSESKCAGNTIQFPVSLGTLAAHSTLHRPMCAQVKSQVYVGDYAELFSFEYSMGPPRPESGVVAIEKTVKLSFLGTDSIAGIPLAFACFVLPGFCFWLVAQWVGGFRNMGQALGDKTIYSIMVSAAIVAIASWLSPLMKWIHQTPLNVSLGVSIGKLAWLSALGAILGLGCGRLEGWYQDRKLRKQQQRQLKANEADTVVLEKLLAKNESLVRPRVTVRVHDRQEAYIGSLYGTTDTETVLVGWFKVKLPGGNKKLEQWKQTRQFARIAEWARKNNLKIEHDRPIRVKAADGAQQDTTDYLKSWKTAEVTATIELEQTQEPLKFT